MNIFERFEDKFVHEPNTGCWLWTGATDAGGYGRFGVDGVNCKAHRVSLFLYRAGSLKDARVACHKCDTPACVNPDHVYLGTQKDNVADLRRRQRSNYARGARVNTAKLTAEQVAEIRRDGRSCAIANAAKYGVHFSTIYRLLRDETWVA